MMGSKREKLNKGSNSKRAKNRNKMELPRRRNHPGEKWSETQREAYTGVER